MNVIAAITRNELAMTFNTLRKSTQIEQTSYGTLEIHIIKLDNAPFYRANQLKIPENIILIFQPPSCHEVNSIERFWGYLKSYLKWSLFDNLELLKEKVALILNSLDEKVIQSLAGWDNILQALSL